VSVFINKTSPVLNCKLPSELGRAVVYFIVVFLSIFTIIPVYSQEARQKATRQSSMDAFNKGDFEKAYTEFSDLLETFPKDPLYKYYSGVCLVRLNRDPDSAVTLLGEAMKGSSVARMVPADALYWHARAMQMSGKYSEAIAEFGEFTGQVGKKVARELNVPEYIQQCGSGKGEIPRQVITEKIVLPVAPAEKPAETSISQSENKPVIKALKQPPEESRLPAKLDTVLADGINLQSKADSLYVSAEAKKSAMDKLPYRDKADLRTKISVDEAAADRYQKDADKKFAEVQSALNIEAPAVKDVVQKPEPTKKDTTAMPGPKPSAEVKVPISGKETKRDSLRIVQNNFQQVFSVFEADTKVAPGDKVEIDPVVPPGLVYRIQIAVFKNPVALSFFKGLSPVYGFKVQGADKTNYYAGMFRKSTDAARALVSVRQKGFKDAFSVSLMDGKPVSPDKAAVLEKEWGSRPFRISAKTGLQVVAADTVPPTLSFRVEILRTEKPVKADQLDEMKRITAARGLDMEKIAEGTSVYLAGKFITYDSAEEYAGLLSKNGFRDAKVTAWLGHKEIPVETARQLFENLE